MRLATLIFFASTTIAIAQNASNDCVPLNVTGGGVYVGTNYFYNDPHKMTSLEKAVQICSWHESSGMIPHEESRSHYAPKWRDCYVLEKRLRDKTQQELKEKQRIADQKDWDAVHAEFMAGVKK